MTSIYDANASQWWSRSSGPFRSLHAITPFRLELIDEWFGDLTGKLVIDIGAGGGLLSVPLAARGAHVIATDLSLQSIREAGRRLPERCGACCADARALPFANGCAAFVVLADVLEHVSPINTVLAEVARVLEPGGHAYVNTLNRSFRSWLLAIVGAESIGLIPKGTHEYRLLVRPDELRRGASKSGLEVLEVVGESPRLRSLAFKRSLELRRGSSLAMAYSVLLRKQR